MRALSTHFYNINDSIIIGSLKDVQITGSLVTSNNKPNHASDIGSLERASKASPQRIKSASPQRIKVASPQTKQPQLNKKMTMLDKLKRLFCCN